LAIHTLQITLLLAYERQETKKTDTPLFNSMQEETTDKMIVSHLFGRKVLRNATPTPQRHWPIERTGTE